MNDTRHLFQIIRKLSGKRARTEFPVEDKIGRLLTSQEQQIPRWVKHFKNLFTIPSDSPVTDFEHRLQVVRIQRINSNTPTVHEIETAIRSIKMNKKSRSVSQSSNSSSSRSSSSSFSCVSSSFSSSSTSSASSQCKSLSLGSSSGVEISYDTSRENKKRSENTPTLCQRNWLENEKEQTNARKTLRISGAEYTTSFKFLITADGSKKRVMVKKDAKKTQPTCHSEKCRLKCLTKLSQEQRQEKAVPGIVELDKLGKHGNQLKLPEDIKEEVRKHINSIPKVKSHFCRAQAKKEYIEGVKSMADLHRDYVELCKAFGKSHVNYAIDTEKACDDAYLLVDKFLCLLLYLLNERFRYWGNFALQKID
ncbi:hypothetical protein ILUMI_03959 [Ignelater luminosus]|uniref:Uncharacterized protein n=1 Tax=Ignelater luminosus TaxID=2038154 RepID=A0A8K0DDH5_IGNLU|nr:hypothetical protein ILUMI_03959 [Ignelater luminosus]